MGKREANRILGAAVADYIREGGKGSALVGYDRVAVLELAVALETMGYDVESKVVWDEGSGIDGGMIRSQTRAVGIGFPHGGF